MGTRETVHNCDGWHSGASNKFAYASSLSYQPIPILMMSTTAPPSPSSVAAPESSGSTLRRNYYQSLTWNTNHNANNKRHQRFIQDQQQQSRLANWSMFDHRDKYPCNYPMIVLCIETIGQNRTPINHLISHGLHINHQATTIGNYNRAIMPINKASSSNSDDQSSDSIDNNIDNINIDNSSH